MAVHTAREEAGLSIFAYSLGLSVRAEAGRRKASEEILLWPFNVLRGSVRKMNSISRTCFDMTKDNGFKLEEG